MAKVFALWTDKESSSANIRAGSAIGIARQLDSLGKKVLLVDAGMESPTIRNTAVEQSGFDSLLLEYLLQHELSWKDVKIKLSKKLDFIPTGRLCKHPWDTYIKETGLGAYLQKIYREWKKSYDVVLINTDGGTLESTRLVLALLAEVMLPIVPLEEASFERAGEIAGRVEEVVNELPVERPTFFAIPLLLGSADSSFGQMLPQAVSHLGKQLDFWRSGDMTKEEALRTFALPEAPGTDTENPSEALNAAFHRIALLLAAEGNAENMQLPSGIF